MGEADTAAITAAVSALLYVTLGRRQLVWGGHPAITPMVWAHAEAMGVDYGAWVKLYQSEFFEDEFPKETALFDNVVVTPEVPEDMAASLAIMREQMLDDTSFGAAVFVGGMQGIMDEFELFKAKAPDAAILPIMTAGGAAAILGQQIGADPEFAQERDYVALLHHQLDIHPSEQRYPTPVEQPEAVADRLRRPPEP
ncbi:SLOG domain-containing protein [Novosphingobium aerophilum]